MTSWLNSKPQETALNILVVSDDIQALSLICGPLTQVGHTVYHVSDAELAVEFLGENPMPDLLIVDFHEPEIDGKAFVEVSRLRFGRKTLAPLVFLRDDVGDERTAQIMDVDDVLSKSEGSAALVDYVQNRARTAAAAR